jgi:hypothetical protein
MSAKPFVSLVALALAAVLASAGCGKKSSPSPSTSDGQTSGPSGAKLVGTWQTEPEQVEVNGKKVGKPMSMTAEFKENGELKLDVIFELTGTWKAVKEEGNTLTIDTEVGMPDFKFEQTTKDGKTVQKSEESVKKERKTFTITFDGPDAMTMTDVGDKPDPMKFKRKK